MARASRLARALFGGALGLTATMVAASGGGGGTSGGSLPSASAPSYDPAAEYKKGVEALDAQNYDDADRAFGHVLEVIPHDANTNFLDGEAKAGRGKLKDAKRCYERAIKYKDDLILAHQELGLTLIKLGDLDGAKAVLADLKQRAATCSDTCAQAADLKSAIAALEAALGAPSTSQLPTASDFLLTSSAQGDHAYLDAVALINQKRYDEALVALDLAARVFGPHPDILTYQGFVNRKLGRFEIAEDYYRQALAAAPNHLGATEYYGELMVERGDLAGARRMLAKLENVCRFGCAQADELRRWIVAAKPHAS